MLKPERRAFRSCQYQLASTSRAAAKPTAARSRSASTPPAARTFSSTSAGRRILLLEVNGKTVAEPSWTGYRLTLPGDLLRPDNTVYVSYENDYDHTGDGFHQFIDPEDGEEYLYTNFEPYEAHRLFPCFDQPDIKARYELTVTAPSEWEVIANARQATEATASDGRRRHKFEKTKPFSTYLFALVARPVRIGARRCTSGIELGLFCRKSLMKHLGSRDEIFDDHQAGPRFLRRVLRLPLPVRKVRPGVRARIQRRGDGERGRDHAQRVHGLPRPADG